MIKYLNLLNNKNISENNIKKLYKNNLIYFEYEEHTIDFNSLEELLLLKSKGEKIFFEAKSACMICNIFDAKMLQTYNYFNLKQKYIIYKFND